jgi:hypothetical protein
MVTCFVAVTILGFRGGFNGSCPKERRGKLMQADIKSVARRRIMDSVSRDRLIVIKKPSGKPDGLDETLAIN